MNLVGTQVTGKTLGIVGGGRIGQAVARRAQGFRMKVIYTDVQKMPAFEAATGGQFVDKETLLKSADFISVHAPLLPSTRHLIGTDEFKLMKKTAILINDARGPIVDEKALVEALRKGQFAGAGLDVFEKEPDLMDGLSELPNVVFVAACRHLDHGNENRDGRRLRQGHCGRAEQQNTAKLPESPG